MVPAKFGKRAAGMLAGLVLIASAPNGAPAVARDMGQKMSQAAFKRTMLMGSNYTVVRKLNDAVEGGNFANAGKAAQKIAANARALAGLWPAGSGGAATAARPLVWRNMDGFKAALAIFQKAPDSAATAAAAQDIAALRKAAAKTKQSCDSCHRTYRRF